ncbi:hypothetical protein [Campylobacter cuniculorum]|uniref:Small hydrophobic protein n=1 Tax=Campylobacter cuniculorum TaxID=374106 RepID=A0ABX6TWN6_9BACT|nr:hypothetical protein [Campylobacter cuniculorum]QOR04132.1 hypothetical protein A0071_08200 [Campylobacter cuniculorum]
MEILRDMLYLFFILFIAFLVVGFNRQMNQRAKEREEKWSQLNKKEKK